VRGRFNDGVDDGASPPLDAVRRVVEELEAVGCTASVGGSGLLMSLGLVGAVRDWDVTTDGPRDRVAAALGATGLAFEERSSGDGVYATSARFAVLAGDHEVDVLVDFAVKVGEGVTRVSSRPASTWRGLPMASPVAWAQAYRVIGREGHAEALDAWIASREGGTT
jgi:hypothetical protein